VSEAKKEASGKLNSILPHINKFTYQFNDAFSVSNVRVVG
jgi:hypothetical protein